MATTRTYPTEEAAPGLAGAVPGMLPPAILHEDELILLLVKPSLWFVLFRTLPSLVLILTLGILSVRTPQVLDYVTRSNVALVTLLVAMGRLVWDAAVWTSHTYVLTNQRIMTIKGVFNVVIFQAPLRKVQRCVVYQPLLERVLGLGSVGFATASANQFDSTWRTLARPVEVSRMIFDAINRHR